MGWEQPSWCHRSGQSKIISILTSVGGSKHTGHFRSTRGAGTSPALALGPLSAGQSEPILPEAPALFVLRWGGTAFPVICLARRARPTIIFLSFPRRQKGHLATAGQARPASAACTDSGPPSPAHGATSLLSPPSAACDQKIPREEGSLRNNEHHH